MTQDAETRIPESQRLSSQHASLDPYSYTAQRLSHANPEHLYITSRRCFIGPIPEGWLKSHRRDWYKHHLHLNYSSRAATFHADPNVSTQRRLSGLEGPSTSATYHQTFRQPDDILNEEDEEEGEQEANVTGEVEVARSSNPNKDVRQVDRQRDGSDEVQEGAHPLNEDTPRLSMQSSSPGLDGAEESREVSEGARESEQPTGKDSERTSTGLGMPPRNSTTEGTTGGGSSRIESMTESQMGVGSSTVDNGTGAGSTKSLLDHKDPTPAENVAEEELPSRSNSGNILSKMVKPSEPASTPLHDVAPADGDHERRRSVLVSFAVPEDSRRAELLHMAKVTQMNLQRSASDFLKGRRKKGRIIKMEKMLVRVDVSADKHLPDDYDENGSLGVISRVSEKWREFMVVCRESNDDDSDFLLEMYKTRVIPIIQDPNTKKRTKYEIPLSKKTSHVNLFSSLDKSVVIWVPYSRGTTIYVLRARSSANAVEWYTFLRNILGWRRTRELQVVVPDLSVTLRLKNPFKEIEASQDFSVDGEIDVNALKKTMDEEQAVSSRIIQRCSEMLRKDPAWAEILDIWTKNDRIGLAWKRYDRLEWIHGANERKMYGTIAMQKSHELEMRPKTHSPTTATTRHGKSLTEPAPVEGFLIRLTSQKGAHQKMGKLFYKRLYFSTHDQFLVFSRPAKAYPPPPPKLPITESSNTPNARQIAEKMPLIYAVNPYPVRDGAITWLGNRQHDLGLIREHDEDAHDEAERRLNIILECDGYIDLCNVRKVRNIKRGATPTDENIDEGSDVDYDEDVPDTMADDGATESLDDERTFELVLSNSLVIRLQAFDKTTKKEWKRRLRELVRYWKHRTVGEMDMLKSVRKQNIEELGIDEDAEATMGQFAKKWEVTQTYASPLLYNMCGISCCRTIHMSGQLYRKPRLHSTFTLTSVLLVPGHVLIFSPTLRTRTGKDIPTIHHERERALDLDLSECYLYSGLLTENDLLYTNKTFDSNRPGRSGLHRWYADDGWRVSDEDIMCTFVLWYQRKKEWLRVPGSGAAAEREGETGTRARLRHVSQLGVKGRSIVFKARSRAERDRWVLAISTEIDRVAGAEDVRLIGAGKTNDSDES
ncbi:hypothetical protein NA57DRAFT_35161 [Rhizodiscina lignyota]|uniref:PH domain-containing protein n=1 Tax=Rhizodiscina lignyota TaxID=1504668 RepID=A0A9P4IKK6_9PEZI|nr:hypothetical protein NA57DRAFT_35161 [Rhizodiscina lignyota]